MNNKSPLALCTFLLLCISSLILNAQEKKTNNDFTISVIKQTDRSNFEKEHFYVLELKNNSKITSEYAISLINKNCSNNKNSHSKSSNKKATNISAEIYFEELNSKKQISETISLKAYESIKIRVRTLQKNNAILNSWSCTEIHANKVSKNISKGSKSNFSKSVTIKTYVPDTSNPGH